MYRLTTFSILVYHHLKCYDLAIEFLFKNKKGGSTLAPCNFLSKQIQEKVLIAGSRR
jgi:hypothetical protein